MAGRRPGPRRADPPGAAGRAWAGLELTTRIGVEDVETAVDAVDAVGRRLADSVVPEGSNDRLAPGVAPHVGWVSLRSTVHHDIAVVHR